METIKRENIQLGDNRKLVATMGVPLPPMSGSSTIVVRSPPTQSPADALPPQPSTVEASVVNPVTSPFEVVDQKPPCEKSVHPQSPTSHRAWFRKSNTCGSLYVQCGCTVESGEDPHTLTSSNQPAERCRSGETSSSSQPDRQQPRPRPISLSDKDIRRIRPRLDKPSFVHPDSPTTVFGEANAKDALVKKAQSTRALIPTAQTPNGDYEILHTATAHSKRYSTPAIGTSYAFHPEFVLQKLDTGTSANGSSAQLNQPPAAQSDPGRSGSKIVFKQRACTSYPGLEGTGRFEGSFSNASSIDEVGAVDEVGGSSVPTLGSLEDLERSQSESTPQQQPVNVPDDTGGTLDTSGHCRGVLIESNSSNTGKVSNACAIPVRKGRELFVDNSGQLSVSLDSGREAHRRGEAAHHHQSGHGGACSAENSPPSPPSLLLSPVIPSKFDCSAKEYLIQSGILGPMGNGSSLLMRKTSKIVPNIDTPVKERIRKNSVKFWGKVLTEDRRKSLTGQCDSLQSYGSSMTISGTEPNSFEDEIIGLRKLLRARDDEIDKLRREIDKLKSVLQQKAVNSLEQPNAQSGQQRLPLVSPSNTPTHKGQNVAEGELLSSIQANYAMAGQPMSELFGISGNSFKLHQMKSVKGITLQAMKKQGVSGESCDLMGSQSSDIKIPKYKKDFSAKQLIKDAIMENDFFKNIDSLQIREIVDSMYSREFRKGEYVIHEGEAGSHLYVSASGEFEVIKDSKVLGVMGPGRAFGELAILYNCTRTASIRVLCDSRVWVLDRRVFQQIMMRTGMQRIEENVNFLKSVPLLKHLSNDVLTKIADVLEVEFYPAGAFIIRQGAAGDTFFLISQGTVKVTQRLPGRSVEEEIRILVRGEYFGEQALIREDKRTANIIAMSPGVECLTLDRESFTKHIGDLCELQEKNYGDEERVLAFRNLENTHPSLGSCQPELLDVNLTDLEVVGTLGVGGFGRVELVKLERNDATQVYALKCMKKRHIVDTRQQEHMYSERKIMLACQSPFICRLYRTYKDTKFVYMLLEACMGGEVWTILRDRVTFEDSTAKFIVACVLQAFDFLHARGIVYRDLKPENLLLDARGYAKLVDFGFSKFIGYSSKTWTFCGTPEYVAPEIILNKGHDRSVDYWALGILIHELLTGIPPFTAADPMKTYNIILKGIDMVNFPKHMSRAAISLIKRLCRDVPSERLGYQRGGVQDIKKHKWFQGFDWDGLIALTLKSPLQPNLQGPLDMSNFDIFPKDLDIPPDELSGWDADF
ncbi:cGMP-dependent protein kinase, isozyme 1 [Anopheles marshallii]|uniref:cGMP-dependent protein kinase, isozyme 1 n=1 Tax=Anopheles marshallii TaxID=1521116 RepID=UPI00237AF352|nr:cGMP-dependent protein kinase, isozyme 1 [Anopheles marshallii]